MSFSCKNGCQESFNEQVGPFVATGLFLYPLKIYFMGYRKRTVSWNDLGEKVSFKSLMKHSAVTLL